MKEDTKFGIILTMLSLKKYNNNKDDRKSSTVGLHISNRYNGTDLTAVTGVGSSPALATCETSHVLLAGVSGGFSRGSPVFAPPTDWPVSYELK